MDSILVGTIISSLSQSWLYNFSLMSCIPVVAYVGVIYCLYSGNLRNLFRINKTNLLWFLGLFLVWGLFFGILLFLNSIITDCMAIADQIQARKYNMNWNRYLPVAIMFLGFGGYFISLSKTFRIKRTITKKVLLFAVCLLPVVCAIYFLQKQPKIDAWPIIRLCVKSSLPFWVLSGMVIMKKRDLLKPKVSHFMTFKHQ